MQYKPGERDMVMLQHRFEIEHKDGSKVLLLDLIEVPLADGHIAGNEDIHSC